jgi:hypothetical protein
MFSGWSSWLFPFCCIRFGGLQREKLPARGRNAIPVCRPSNGSMPRRDNRASFRMTFELFLEIDRPCALQVLVRVVETASFSAVARERVRPKLQPPDRLRGLKSTRKLRLIDDGQMCWT